VKVPAAFENCVKKGGKVRTIVVNKKKGKYMHVCYKGGKSYPGEVHTKKSKAELEQIIEDLKELERYWHDRNNYKEGE
jgi:hypothetical protein